MAGEEIAEQRQRLGLRRRAGRALIGGVGGGLAALDQVVAAGRLCVVGRSAELGERQPRSGDLGVGGNDRAEPGAGVLVIAGGDCGRRVLAQLLDGLALQLRADLRRLFAQRVGQPHDVAGEVVAGVGLDLGGGERDAGGEQQGERQEAANDLEHVSTLVGGFGPRRSRRTVKGTGDGVLTGQPMLA